MAYTTLAKINDYLGSDLTSISTSVTAWISSAKAWIDKYTGKTFETAVASTKYYDGNGSDRILIDSLVGTPSEVSILDSQGNTQQTLVLNTDYLLYPLNTTEKYEIRFIRSIDWDWAEMEEWPKFYKGNKRLKVTADFWASATVPADIELAATMLVAAVAGQALSANLGSDGGGGAVKSESLGDYSITYASADAQIGSTAESLGLSVTSILDSYREPSL
jgi:hypothetical protein